MRDFPTGNTGSHSGEVPSHRPGFRPRAAAGTEQRIALDLQRAEAARLASRLPRRCTQPSRAGKATGLEDPPPRPPGPTSCLVTVATTTTNTAVSSARSAYNRSSRDAAPNTAPDSAPTVGVSSAPCHLHWFRRPRIRREIRDDIHEAFLTLGYMLICWRRLSQLTRSPALPQ